MFHLKTQSEMKKKNKRKIGFLAGLTAAKKSKTVRKGLVYTALISTTAVGLLAGGTYAAVKALTEDK